MDSEIPDALYVHVPFCRRKCGYCDFYSVDDSDPARFDAYLSGVRRELDRAPRAALRTVYVGGGTPTTLPADCLEVFLAAVRAEYSLAEVTEFTFESNPGVLDLPRARLLVDSGVNRISLGVQSMSPPALRTLGRLHGPQEVRDAARMLRNLGLANLSLDLIFGVPGQSLKEWLIDVDAVLEFEPEHLSVYGLSLSPGTPLGRRVRAGEVTMPADDLYADMLMAGHDRLASAGYEHYEISNFARPGFRCRHNLTYWCNRPYVGIGPAAASYVDGRRWTNIADLDAWADRLGRGESPVDSEETLAAERRARETAMLGLRMLEGLSIAEFRTQTGYDPLVLFADPIERYGAQGFLNVSADRIALAVSALPVTDTILADFLA